MNRNRLKLLGYVCGALTLAFGIYGMTFGPGLKEKKFLEFHDRQISDLKQTERELASVDVDKQYEKWSRLASKHSGQLSAAQMCEEAIHVEQQKWVPKRDEAFSVSGGFAVASFVVVLYCFLHPKKI